MKTRRVDRAGIDITPLGMGTWAMGAGKSGTSNLGSADDSESVEAIRRGLDLGLNWIDTAAYYGFGHAEEIVARALKGVSERPYVFTKCGLVPAMHGEAAHEFRLRGWSIREEIEASLRRLQSDWLDLVMLHWPLPEQDIEEGWTTLRELQTEGKARLIGVSNFNGDQLAACERIAPVQIVQPEYSLVERKAEDTVFPYTSDHNLDAIVYSPLKHGLLSGSMTRERVAGLAPTDWRHGHVEYTEPRLSRNLRIADAVRTIAAHYGCTPAAVAIAWTLRRPEVVGAIVGGRRASQFADIINAADLEISDDDYADLQSISNEADERLAAGRTG